MRKMKDSGIEWIGEIPESWATKKLSYYFKKIGSGTTPDTANGYFYDGEYNWLQTGDLTDSYITSTSKRITQEAVDAYSALTFFKKGAVVIAMYGATIGKLGILDIDCFTNQACCALSEPKEANSKFVYYWLLCNRENIVRLSLGGGQPNISQGIITSLKVSAPTSVDEQTRIVTYLDQKCAEIDTIIAAKEKTNELLKEHRQSIIYEAVTKGLDPTVPMKDSGVEWIGEIPESWDTCKLKYAVECRTEKTVDKSASVAYIGLEHVKSDFGVLVDEYEHIWDFEGDTIDFKAGDVLFGKLRPYLAKAWAASFNGKCSSEFWVMTPVKLTSKFLLYTVLSNHFIANIDHSTFGVKMPRAEWEYAGNQLICCPSIAEQENITEYLDLKCSEIDSLISENAESIEMLKEYRQSVIYEAVTGKVEI